MIDGAYYIVDVSRAQARKKQSWAFLCFSVFSPVSIFFCGNHQWLIWVAYTTRQITSLLVSSCEVIKKYKKATYLFIVQWWLVSPFLGYNFLNHHLITVIIVPVSISMWKFNRFWSSGDESVSLVLMWNVNRALIKCCIDSD